MSVDIITSCWPPIFATAFLSVQVYGMLMARELAQLSREMTLAAEACVDPLTGIVNRRGFSERLESLQSSRGRIFVLMIDADKFKSINDTYGHPAGDAWLVAFVQLARDLLPTGAVLARLGGEEFAVILADGDKAQSANVAEELRRKVQSLQITPLGETPLQRFCGMAQPFAWMECGGMPAVIWLQMPTYYEATSQIHSWVECSMPPRFRLDALPGQADTARPQPIGKITPNLVSNP